MLYAFQSDQRIQRWVDDTALQDPLIPSELATIERHGSVGIGQEAASRTNQQTTSAHIDSERRGENTPHDEPQVVHAQQDKQAISDSSPSHQSHYPVRDNRRSLRPDIQTLPQQTHLVHVSQCKNQKVASNQMASSFVESPSKKYTRRTRHKTKPEKYQFKGGLQDAKTVESRKRLKGKGSETRRTAGAVLNQKFEALNVEPERLTLERGNSRRGLFSKAKSSVPIEHRDLPDLTFSKMSFLSHRKRRTNQSLQESTRKKTKQDVKRHQLQEMGDYFEVEIKNSKVEPRMHGLDSPLGDKKFRQPSTRSTKERSVLYRDDYQQFCLGIHPEKVLSSSTSNHIPSQPKHRIGREISRPSPSVSWPSSPYRVSIRAAPEMVTAPSDALQGPNTISRSSRSRSLQLEEYTRQALIRSQPGVWRKMQNTHDVSSVRSLEDLKRLAERVRQTREHGLEMHGYKSCAMPEPQPDMEQFSQPSVSTLDPRHKRYLQLSSTHELSSLLDHRHDHCSLGSPMAYYSSRVEAESCDTADAIPEFILYNDDSIFLPGQETPTQQNFQFLATAGRGFDRVNCVSRIGDQTDANCWLSELSTQNIHDRGDSLLPGQQPERPSGSREILFHQASTNDSNHEPPISYLVQQHAMMNTAYIPSPERTQGHWQTDSQSLANLKSPWIYQHNAVNLDASEHVSYQPSQKWSKSCIRQSEYDQNSTRTGCNEHGSCTSDTSEAKLTIVRHVDDFGFRSFTGFSRPHVLY